MPPQPRRSAGRSRADDARCPGQEHRPASLADAASETRSSACYQEARSFDGGSLPQARDQRHGISRGKARYDGCELSEAKRLKALEGQNGKLNWLLAEAMLDNAALKDLLQKLTSPAARPVAARRLVTEPGFLQRRASGLVWSIRRPCGELPAVPEAPQSRERLSELAGQWSGEIGRPEGSLHELLCRSELTR